MYNGHTQLSLTKQLPGYKYFPNFMVGETGIRCLHVYGFYTVRVDTHWSDLESPPYILIIYAVYCYYVQYR
jgi:hypothetical protein